MIVAALPDLKRLLEAFEADPTDMGCLRALADCLEDECDEPELAEACRWLLVAVPACAEGSLGRFYYWVKAVADKTWRMPTLLDRTMCSKPPRVIAACFTSIEWAPFHQYPNAMTAVRRCLVAAVRIKVTLS